MCWEWQGLQAAGVYNYTLTLTMNGHKGMYNRIVNDYSWNAN